MNRSRGALLILLLFGAAAAANTQESLKNGTTAYNAGNFALAVEQFEQAVKADPQSLLARQHLANARVRRFLSASPFDRVALAKAARAAVADVLARSPKDAVALWHMAAMELDTGNLSEAAAWCQKLTAANPKSKNGYYTLGVIQWMESYQAIAAAKKKAGILPSDPPPIKDVVTREVLRSSQLKGIAEGHKFLEKALALDAEFGAALAYDNLLYRVEAELANSPAEAQALNARADDRLKKARALLETGKKTETQAYLRPDEPPPATAPVPPPPPRPGS